jgi:ribosome-binding ATPase YchF (GTP1/OBG family)
VRRTWPAKRTAWRRLSELIDLRQEASAFLKDLGVAESGTGALIRATYHLLGLRTYFTAGEKEVRAWTIHVGDTAPKAAGVIHSDFERGFIKAETVAYDDLVTCGSTANAREKATGWRARSTSSRTATSCSSSSTHCENRADPGLRRGVGSLDPTWKGEV